jgi:AcrR family transcriptional regulator
MSTPTTPLRADAQRNRDRLLEVARLALAAGDGAVALESIAKDAGVGIGTLYRNFPTRDDLVEAVYRSELADVLARADELLATLPPDRALRAWMDDYAAFVGAKRGMAESLRGILQSGAISSSQTRPQVIATAQRIMDAGIADGTLRAGVRADDVVTSMIGVFLANPGSTHSEQTGRMLDLLFEGVRVR